MSNRANNNDALKLSLEILKRIPRHGKTTVQQLHRQVTDAGFKISERSMQRRLKMLAESFDIELDDRDKPYGYRWKQLSEGFSLPSLNERESLILMLAEEHLKNILPPSVMNSMKSFFMQARSNLSDYSSKKLEKEWLSKVRVISETQPLLPATIKPGVLEAVSNALYRNVWLKIVYENAHGKQTDAEVMPLGLAQQGPRLYLVCRYHGYENERTLALHRFISAKESTIPFQRPKDFDLKSYDDDGRFGFGEGQRIKLTFRITKEVGAHLLETRLSEDQVVKDVKDEYEISATVVDTARLDWWLNSFGDDVSMVKKTKIK